jgi:hypothetical protein
MVSFPLMAVATEAAQRRVPVLLTGGKIVPIPDPTPLGLPLLGIRLSRSVDAVASRAGFGRTGSPPPVVAVDRFGEAVLLDPLLEAPYDVTGETSIVVDTGLRALGLETSAPDRSVLSLLDAVWLDRTLMVTLAAPVGEPPGWGELATLHPCAPATGRLTSPEHLVHRRRVASLSWPAFRSSLIEGMVSWSPITGALAAWFDPGSLCRHLFSLLPEPEIVRAELCELLSAQDSARIEAVMVS